LNELSEGTEVQLMVMGLSDLTSDGVSSVRAAATDTKTARRLNLANIVGRVIGRQGARGAR